MNINKRKLYIDLDNTVFNSVKAVVDLYNIDFCKHDNYKHIHWTDISEYGFTQLHCGQDLDYNNYYYKYFDDKRFFDILEYMDNAEEVLQELFRRFYIIFVSKGSEKNKQLKSAYLSKLFNGLDYDLIMLAEHTTDKSSVDMSDGICFIDDMPTNLQYSNCPHKVLFGDIFEWVDVDISNYVLCVNWVDVLNYINTLGD